MAGSEWGEIPVGYDEKVKISDLVEMVDTTKLKKFKPFRPIGLVFMYKQIWVPIYKDGKPVMRTSTQQLQIPKIVTNFDYETLSYTKAKCPYQELAVKMNKHLDSKKQLYEAPVYLTNVINRASQDEMPESVKSPTKEETKTGFRDIDSKHKNPVQVLGINSSHSYKKIKDTTEMNVVKLKSGEKVIKGPNDRKFGYDLQIKVDPEQKVKSDRFLVQKGDKSPLTEEEQEYLPWDIQSAINSQIDTLENAQKEADRLWGEFAKFLKASKSSDDDEDAPEDLEDDDEVKPKKKKSSFSDDDEEDEPVVKKKKKKVVEDDDEDEPVVRKKKKPVEDEEEDEPTPKKKKKIVVEDDEEDDPPPKKKKKVILEDDEEEPAPKKKKKIVYDDDEEDEPVVKKKKKKVVEEDDDDAIEGLDEDD